MIRFLSAVILLLLSFVPARAEAPLCQGRDLLAQLKRDNPSAYGEVMAQAAAVKNGEAILWKIERQGLAPSWLFGTAHVTDPRVRAIPRAAQTAFRDAKTVALELKEIRKPQELALAMMRHASLMVLPQGKTLWDLIPDSEEALIRDNANLAPGAAKTIFGYQPWVVAAMLSIPACEAQRKQAGIASLDEMLAAEAESQGKELAGLETVEEQLSVFAAMPLDLQTNYLLAVARFGSKTLDYFETLISLYEQRHVAAYLPLALKLEPPDSDTAAIVNFVEKDLTVKRNQVMAARAAALLAKGDVFIAVGAMHLPGDKGLVELIRQAGYKVTPVN